MASIKHIPGKFVERVVREETSPEEFLITLSKEEAISLFLVTCKVGGSPDATRRGDIDSIHNALSTYVKPELPKDHHWQRQSNGGLRLNGSLEFADENGLIAAERNSR